MRLILAFLAVVALLANPVAASASRRDCAHRASAMPGMQGPGMPSVRADGPSGATDPCCDHPVSGGANSKSCAHACATSCGVVGALPGGPLGAYLPPASAPIALAPSIRIDGIKPTALKRPPRPIA